MGLMQDTMLDKGICPVRKNWGEVGFNECWGEETSTGRSDLERVF
jgi:hypothetical protein